MPNAGSARLPKPRASPGESTVNCCAQFLPRLDLFARRCTIHPGAEGLIRFVPTSTNPILDTTGASAGLGDVGPVFFLAGTFETTPVTRTFSVPGDKPIFFPLINSFLSAEGDADVMRQRVDAFIDTVTTLHASVNGVAIPDLVLAS